MGWLKNIFNKAEEEKGKTAAAAEAVSGDLNKENIVVMPFHQISLESADLEKLGQITLKSISHKCIGIDAVKIEEWPETFNGTVKGEKGDFAIEGKKYKQTENIVFFEITSDTSELERYLQRKFHIAYAAQDATSIDTSLLKEIDQGQPKWYQSGSEFELYLIENGENTVHFHMSFHGMYLEGGQGLPVRAAEIKEIGGKVDRNDLEFMDQVPKRSIEQAMVFVGNIDNLETYHYVNIMLGLKASLEG